MQFLALLLIDWIERTLAGLWPELGLLLLHQLSLSTRTAGMTLKQREDSGPWTLHSFSQSHQSCRSPVREVRGGFKKGGGAKIHSYQCSVLGSRETWRKMGARKMGFLLMLHTALTFLIVPAAPGQNPDFFFCYSNPLGSDLSLPLVSDNRQREEEVTCLQGVS